MAYFVIRTTSYVTQCKQVWGRAPSRPRQTCSRAGSRWAVCRRPMTSMGSNFQARRSGCLPFACGNEVKMEANQISDFCEMKIDEPFVWITSVTVSSISPYRLPTYLLVPYLPCYLCNPSLEVGKLWSIGRTSEATLPQLLSGWTILCHTISNNQITHSSAGSQSSVKVNLNFFSIFIFFSYCQSGVVQ
ncbi:hypothetical protein BGZ63DRAFT_20792 [Mariannaea sp. PMI_226]|nr:hypothetical protein BGZ63DRAFT_20792 [Mariannaea sp. PMI_226]